MLAAISPRSSGGKPHESPLSGLDERPLEPGSREVDFGHGLAVDLDPSLGDQAPRLARGADAELLDEQGRQMNRIAIGQSSLGDLLWSLMLAHHAGEVLL